MLQGLPEGAPRVERSELTSVVCGECDLPGLLVGSSFSGLDELTLEGVSRSLTDRALDQAGAACPRCGGRMRASLVTSAYWPDEPGMPALGWQIDGDGERRWILIDAPSPTEAGNLEQISVSLLGARDHANLGGDADVDEDVLVERWGRVLSVRQHWRTIFGRLAEGTKTIALVAPGLTLLAMRPPAWSDEDFERFQVLLADKGPEAIGDYRSEATDWMQEQIELTKTTIADIERPLYVPLSVGAHVAGGYREWLGPHAGEISVSLHGFVFVDLDVVDDQLEREVERLGLEAVDEPAPRSIESETFDQLKKGMAETPEEPDENDESVFSADTRWYAWRDVSFPVSPSRLATICAVYGLTPAEAVNSELTKARIRCDVAAEALELIRALPEAAGWTVELRAIHDCRAFRERDGDVEAWVFNLSSMLSKHSWKPNEQLLERFRHTFDVFGHGKRKDIGETCFCGEMVPMRHLLRTPSRKETTGFEQDVADAVGQTFTLVPCHDCKHSVAWWTEDYARERAEAEGADVVAAELEAGQRRAGFKLTGSTLLDIENHPMGIMLVGEYAATLLAVPELRATLVRRLRKRMPAETSLIAVAPTTDVIVVVPAVEEATNNVDLILQQFKVDEEKDLPGRDLGFVCELKAKGARSGLVEIDWQS
jgi:hypothetical protein